MPIVLLLESELLDWATLIRTLFRFNTVQHGNFQASLNNIMADLCSTEFSIYQGVFIASLLFTCGLSLYARSQRNFQHDLVRGQKVYMCCGAVKFAIGILLWTVLYPRDCVGSTFIFSAPSLVFASSAASFTTLPFVPSSSPSFSGSRSGTAGTPMGGGRLNSPLPRHTLPSRPAPSALWNASGSQYASGRV